MNISKKKDERRLFKRCLAFTLSLAVTLPTVATGNISYDNSGSVYAATEDVVYGDVNSDSKIDLLDMLLLKSYVTDKSTDGFSVKSADLDGDGKISAKDVVELSMYLLNQTGSFSYEMNVDTDGDGLCDYVEKEMLKTDYQKKDTDGDGLDDYSEVYLCNTDPLSADTGKAGISDSLKDADGDKLTNVEEIKYGTSPSVIDTDEDGLDDYAEVSKHKTDPLKCDTDGDGISDNGELKLGLDPLKVMTDKKTSDSERTFEQELSQSDKLLETINGEDSPYSLSVSVKAAGYISESINIDVSLYSNYLQNDSVEGDIVDIDYNDDLKFESMTINFDVSENAEKYFIFRYFDDIGMLVPVDTQYDGNRVYTVSAEDGTYCIVDIENWMSNNAETAKFYDNTQESVKSSEVSESLEVYFLMYVKSSSADGARNSVAKATRAIIDYCNKQERDVKIYCAYYAGSMFVSKETKKDYVSNTSTDEEIVEMLSMLSSSGSAQESLDTTHFNFSLTSALKKSLLEVSGQSEDSEKYCFVVDLKFEPTSSSNIAVVNQMKDNGVDFSFICSKNNKNIHDYECLSSDGSYIEWIPDFSEIVIEKVISEKEDDDNDNDNIVVSYSVNTGLCSQISYDSSKITAKWKEYFEDFYSGDISLSDVKKLGLPDTDGDGTPDCIEIDMKYISFDEKGNMVLPTYDDMASDALKNSAFGLDGLDDLFAILSQKGVDMKNVYILPLKSNPTIADSDYDGIVDENDEKPKKENTIEIDDEILDDSKVFEDDYKILNTVAVSGDGIAYSQEGEKRNNAICYSRVINSDKAMSRYMIKPDKNSDYRITVDCAEKDRYDISVYTKGLLGDRHDVEPVKKEGSTKGEAYEVYVLEDGEKYYIDITVRPKVLTDNSYEVKIEQDNWVYAPNGAIADYSDPDSIYDNVIIYLPDYVVKKIIANYYYKEYLDRLAISDFNDKTKEQALASCDTYADILIESYNLSYNSDELTKISDINTAAGVIVTLSASLVPSVASALEPVGMVATYFGGYLVGLTRENSFYKSKLKNALYDGEYNLEMLITSYYRRDYPSYKEIYESDVEWCPWHYNNGYINQYHAITRYSKSLKIRANKIEPLNYYTPKKNSSNEWELVPYEFEES